MITLNRDMIETFRTVHSSMALRNTKRRLYPNIFFLENAQYDRKFSQPRDNLFTLKPLFNPIK